MISNLRDSSQDPIFQRKMCLKFTDLQSETIALDPNVRL